MWGVWEVWEVWEVSGGCVTPVLDINFITSWKISAVTHQAKNL
ncbi:hypothetical protein [Okeania sp. SIO3I5]|nr:hypothetical protein [Okeania sp. SIO3I5]